VGPVERAERVHGHIMGLRMVSAAHMLLVSKSCAFEDFIFVTFEISLRVKWILIDIGNFFL
jgi:hypothetical protein